MEIIKHNNTKKLYKRDGEMDITFSVKLLKGFN